MANRRPLYVASNGTMSVIASPDTIDPAILPVTAGLSTANLHAAQLAESSVTHVWRCNDAAGSTTLADSKGSVTLAVGGNVTLGSAGLYNDGFTSAFLTGTSSSRLTAASGTIASSTPSTLEYLVGGGYNYNNENANIYSCTGSGGAITLNLDKSNNNCLTLGFAGSGHPLGRFPLPRMLITIAQQGSNTSNNGSLYINGVFALSMVSIASHDGALFFGIYTDSSTFANMMFIQNIATYSSVLSPASILAHAASIGMA